MLPDLRGANGAILVLGCLPTRNGGSDSHMWLYTIAIALVVIGLVGGIAFGGIFTLVLVPLGLIAVCAAIGFAAYARWAGAGSGGAAGARRPERRPLPTSQRRDSGHVPTSPEALVDARREQQ